MSRSACTRSHRARVLALAALLVCLAAGVHGAERLRLATTTSTENSGLLAVLNPVFEQRHGVEVDVIAVGTGKALRLGENGDVDVVFVHAPPAEEAFVAAGHGVGRRPVMHNDFVILGPPSDPAGARGARTAAEALRRIAAAGESFVSRGDDSGTHKKEKSLWDTAGASPGGRWYLAVGQGMGATLQIAADKLAYTLADRGTWLAYRGDTPLEVVLEGDPALFNPYHIIAVNPERHSHAKHGLARAYIEFVTGREGQRLVDRYRVDGERLFRPDAIPDP